MSDEPTVVVTADVFAFVTAQKNRGEARRFSDLKT
jgi:hypothetical protein